jgi:hypothetical protein
MKQKVNDWLLRLVRIDSCGNREVSHVCLYDMSRTQVMKLAEDYGKDFAAVRVFKLEVIL